jgi:prepilin-type N-terminal cleavage/methylation domain-containing protein
MLWNKIKAYAMCYNTTMVRTRENGFTIVELLVVIIVIAILTAITIVSYTAVQNASKESVVQQDLATFGKIMTRYKADTGSYPSDTTSILTDSYRVSFHTGVLETNTAYNLIYCSVSPYGSYSLLALTKTGKRFYIQDGDVAKEYTGSVAWTGTTLSTICSSVKSGTTNAGVPGYRKSGSPAGWQTWSNPV